MTVPSNPFDRKNRRILFDGPDGLIDPKHFYTEKESSDGKSFPITEGRIVLEGPNGFGQCLTVGAWRRCPSGNIRICARKFFTSGQLDLGDWHGLFYKTNPGMTKRWGICMPGKTRFTAFGSLKKLMKQFQILSR